MIVLLTLLLLPYAISDQSSGDGVYPNCKILDTTGNLIAGQVQNNIMQSTPLRNQVICCYMSVQDSRGSVTGDISYCFVTNFGPVDCGSDVIAVHCSSGAYTTYCSGNTLIAIAPAVGSAGATCVPSSSFNNKEQSPRCINHPACATTIPTLSPSSNPTLHPTLSVSSPSSNPLTLNPSSNPLTLNPSSPSLNPTLFGTEFEKTESWFLVNNSLVYCESGMINSTFAVICGILLGMGKLLGMFDELLRRVKHDLFGESVTKGDEAKSSLFLWFSDFLIVALGCQFNNIFSIGNENSTFWCNILLTVTGGLELILFRKTIMFVSLRFISQILFLSLTIFSIYNFYPLNISLLVNLVLFLGLSSILCNKDSSKWVLFLVSWTAYIFPPLLLQIIFIEIPSWFSPASSIVLICTGCFQVILRICIYFSSDSLISDAKRIDYVLVFTIQLIVMIQVISIQIASLCLYDVTSIINSVLSGIYFPLAIGFYVQHNGFLQSNNTIDNKKAHHEVESTTTISPEKDVISIENTREAHNNNENKSHLFKNVPFGGNIVVNILTGARRCIRVGGVIGDLYDRKTNGPHSGLTT